MATIKSEAAATYQLIPLEKIDEGPNARKTYEKGPLGDLAKSIKERGLAQPVLVRPIDGGRFSLVAGFRRFRAFALNKEEAIPAFVRELLDDEAADLQTMENLQRVDLAPLDEAELFASMLKRGKTAADVARITGKKTGEVVKQIALLDLAPEVKKALAGGALPVGLARILGRIPDAKLQVMALPKMFHGGGREYDHAAGKEVQVPRSPLSEKAAIAVIEKSFMFDIGKAPFDPKDPTLSPLGACTTCPYLTGNSRDLFGDVSNGSYCTNPPDYELKVDTWLQRQADAGAKLLPKSEYKKMWPYEHSSHVASNAVVDLDEEMHTGNGWKKRITLLTKEQSAGVLLAFHRGQLRHLMPTDEFNAAMKANGYGDRDRFGGGGARAKTEQEREFDFNKRVDATVRKAIMEEFVAKVRGAKGMKLEAVFDFIGRCVIVGKGWGLDDVLPRHTEITKEKLGTRGGREAMAVKMFAKMSLQEKIAFIIDAEINGWNAGGVGTEKNRMFAEGVTMFGVDAAGIRKKITAEMREKKKARDEAKKKKAAKEAKKKPAADTPAKGKKAAKKKAVRKPKRGALANAAADADEIEG